MPSDVSDVVQQGLWYNSLIKVGGKPFCINSALKAGLVKIKDIIDDTGAFLTYNTLILKYGQVMSWFQYHQLLSSIHPQWKVELKENFQYVQNFVLVTKFQDLEGETKWSKIVYDEMIERNYEECLFWKNARWNRYLDINLSIEEFAGHFRNIIKSTISTKLRDFQFRLLQCAILLICYFVGN